MNINCRNCTDGTIYELLDNELVAQPCIQCKGGIDMFHIKGFTKDGELIEVANEQPAFWGLYINGYRLGYFITVEDCRLAADDYMACPESVEGL